VRISGSRAVTRSELAFHLSTITRRKIGVKDFGGFCHSPRRKEIERSENSERNRTDLLGVRTWQPQRGDSSGGARSSWLRGQRRDVRETLTASPRAGTGVTGDAEDDLRLLRAGQTGDREALAALFTRHETALFRVCRGILPNPTDAEDAVQETLLRALRALAKPDGFRGDSSVRTWLHRIAVNVCLDWKRQHRQTVVSLDESLAAVHGPSEPGPEVTIMERMRVAEALRRLMPRQRALILLREQEEWSAPEIAEMLGWNVKKVEYELFKARKILAAWRAEEGKDG
jgi:RNA polymerase sigma-70 factor, ECF subfamily